MRVASSIGLAATVLLAAGFDAVSFKHTANMWDGGRIEGGQHYTRPMRQIQFKGNRLSGEVPLGSFVHFACLPLLQSWKVEGPNWLYEEYYQIEAVAPAGTTIDEARSLMRSVLADRLGFRYHLVDREAQVLALVRGSTPLKLTTATQPEPNPGARQMGAFQNKSATLGDFANFLSTLSDREVVDRTGISGRYEFHVDWSKEIADTMREYGRHGSPSIVSNGLKQLGLKLEPRKEQQKVLVIDRINKEPTPN